MRGSPRRRAIVDYSEVDLEEVQASIHCKRGDVRVPIKDVARTCMK